MIAESFERIHRSNLIGMGILPLEFPAGVTRKTLQLTGEERIDIADLTQLSGNHEVMMRGTFANIRIRNEMVPGTEGGYTRHFPGNETLAIYDAAMKYKEEGVPLAVVAGKEYGSGAFFDDMEKTPKPVEDIRGARILAMLGDSVTTDHISPAGSIKAESPAGRYLLAKGIERNDFNSYGSRAGKDVYLKDIWPSPEEIAASVQLVNSSMFRKEYAEVFDGTPDWQQISVSEAATYDWDEGSTYIRLSSDEIESVIKEGDLTVGAVLSGNRNFEGRIHPLIKTNWLASPPLVVAYALAGNMNINLQSEPIGQDQAAGLLAKKAVERGLKRQPWVKASLAPGSKVVSDYLATARLTPYLDKLGFNLVGYGCTTCIGNSGPLHRVALGDVPAAFAASNELEINQAQKPHKAVSYRDSETRQSHQLDDGAVVIAAITSCTNTSNPSVLMLFPIDDVTLSYMTLTGRDEQQVKLTEAYAKQQGLWRNAGDEPIFTSTLALDMADVESSIAGPKRPQIGFKLTGKLRPGITATDLVLTVTQMLRKHGVVGKFVEFYGDGLADLPLADRATIANMAPEYGATCGHLEYLGKSVWHEELEGKNVAWPDTLVGTDSHTTMINALGVLGWGVGGIEAEAAMLGQPVSMLIPDVYPLSPVDLVIDHSVTVDRFGNDDAFGENVRLEMERNHERYVFLRWGQKAFNRFRVVPPGTGICHQVWQDGESVTLEDIQALADWQQTAHADREIAYRPARVLMQDFTGVPAVVDLAAMREAVARLGGDVAKVTCTL
ncbi:hypothetical protein CRX72_18715 [Pantoea sp. BRM17]|nr:hypothetical protein CRX72_18715 [Pantoea sp. BRM17]